MKQAIIFAAALAALTGAHGPLVEMNVYEADPCCDEHDHCETPVEEPEPTTEPEPTPVPTTYEIDLTGFCSTTCVVPYECPSLTGLTTTEVFTLFDPTFDPA